MSILSSMISNGVRGRIGGLHDIVSTPIEISPYSNFSILDDCLAGLGML